MAEHPWSFAADVDPEFEAYPVLASAVIEHGDLLSVDASGYARRIASADTKFIGIAEQTVTGTSTSGARRVRVRTRGTIFTSTAVTGMTIANVGDTVYSNDPLGAFNATSTNRAVIGKLAGRDPGGLWEIAFETSVKRSV